MRWAGRRGAVRTGSRADEAQAAPADPNIAPCDFCRPDTEVGLDVA
ncbi:DUF6233 domain-containing protein [Streptomyces lydicus]